MTDVVDLFVVVVKLAKMRVIRKNALRVNIQTKLNIHKWESRGEYLE
jgi:hypothetical protein